MVFSGNCIPNQNLPRSSAPLPQVKARRQAALIKIHELEKVVENWDSRDLGQCCNEFVRGKNSFMFYILSIAILN